MAGRTSARDQVPGYLLGELSRAERARFEAALEQDAALHAEVERLRPVVARLLALDPAGRDPPASRRRRWWR